MSELFDVIEVALDAPHAVRVIAGGKTEKNAEAIEQMAVMWRGVETCFYTICPAGEYSDGDLYYRPNSK